MIEGVDYELVPNEDDSWDVRVMTGNYSETIFAYNALRIVESTEELKFSARIIYTPDPPLFTDDPDFQKVAGDILFNILENLSNEQENK